MNLKSIFFIVIIVVLNNVALSQNSKGHTDDVYVKKTEQRNGKLTDIYIIEEGDKAYQIEKQNTTIIKFVIDGEAVSKAELPKYKEQIKKLIDACNVYISTHKTANVNAQNKDDDEEGLKVKVNKKVAVRIYDEDIAKVYESGKKLGTEILNRVSNIFK